MMMKSPVILVACVLLLAALTVLASENSFSPSECCFKYVSKPLPKNRVLRCKNTNELCPKRAVVLTMKNGNEYCANPSEQWVQNIIKAQRGK